MPDKWPLANGNWSTAANWNDGTKPNFGDTVYADGKTVAIDENATVESVRTTQRSGGTAGGGFTLNAGSALTANVIAGTTTCVTFSAASGSATIIGNVNGSTTTQSSAGVSHTGTAALTVIGNVSSSHSPQGGAHGIVISSSGSLSVTGLVGPTNPVGNAVSAVYVSGSATVQITGNVAGGSGNVAGHGVYLQVAASLSVVGGVRGNTGSGSNKNGVGIYNNATGSVVVVGDVTGGNGSSAYGIQNASTGSVSVLGSVAAGTAKNSVGLYSVAGGEVHLEGDQIGSVGTGGEIGTTGVAATVLAIHNAENYVAQFARAAGGIPGLPTGFAVPGTLDTLYGVLHPDGQSGQAQPANVRYGTVYGPSSELAGTCHVPPASSVAAGVPVDATVGTAVLTAAGVREAVGLASANLDAQFAAISVDPQSIRDAMLLEPTGGGESIDGQLAALPDATTIQAAAAAAITAAGLPTAAQIDTQLSGAHGDGSWESASTGGIYTQTVTVTSDGSAAIPNATVAIYSGSTLVDLKTTNSSGVATPTCDAGTYTLRVTASGYASHSAALTVTGDATIATITLTAISVTAPTNPGTATGRLDLHAKDTMAAAYQSIYVRQTARRSTDGHGDSKEWREIVADASGVIEAPFWKSQAYEAKRGKDGTPVAFTVGTEDTFYLPSILGEP